MEPNTRNTIGGLVLAAAIGAAPATLMSSDSARVRAAIFADGCAAAAQEVRNSCGAHPSPEVCLSMATWLDVRCKEKAKRD